MFYNHFKAGIWLNRTTWPNTFQKNTTCPLRNLNWTEFNMRKQCLGKFSSSSSRRFFHSSPAGSMVQFQWWVLQNLEPVVWVSRNWSGNQNQPRIQFTGGCVTISLSLDKKTLLRRNLASASIRDKPRLSGSLTPQMQKICRFYICGCLQQVQENKKLLQYPDALALTTCKIETHEPEMSQSPTMPTTLPSIDFDNDLNCKAW